MAQVVIDFSSDSMYLKDWRSLSVQMSRRLCLCFTALKCCISWTGSSSVELQTPTSLPWQWDNNEARMMIHSLGTMAANDGKCGALLATEIISKIAASDGFHRNAGLVPSNPCQPLFPRCVTTGTSACDFLSRHECQPFPWLTAHHHARPSVTGKGDLFILSLGRSATGGNWNHLLKFK